MKQTKHYLKRLLSLLLIITVIVPSGISLCTPAISVSAADNNSKYIAAVGTVPFGYTSISTAEELASITEDMAGKYILTSDIDLSGKDWQPIGRLGTNPFRGILDGNGHQITGLSVNETFNSGTILPPCYSVGLFGVCDGAEIRNLGLENVKVSVSTTSGYQYSSNLDAEYTVFAGAVTGFAKGETVISNCYASGTVQARASGEGYSATIAGGIAGYINSCTVEYCRNLCSVTAYNGNAVQGFDAIAGGVAGRAAGNTSITVSCNQNSISATTLDYGRAYAGGLLGYSAGSAVGIVNTFNTGTIQSISGSNFCDPAFAGGVCAKYSGHIRDSYNRGKVTATAKDPYGINHSEAYSGGICGQAETGASISNCVSAEAHVSSSASGTRSQYRISNGGSKTDNFTIDSVASGSVNDADSAADQETIRSGAFWNSRLGWDFAFIWTMEGGGGYPTFQLIILQSAGQDGFHWNISDTGTLTITGKGDMPEWEGAGEVPWHAQSSAIREVEIGDGITSIGPYAFYWCGNLSDVSIGKTVKRIGKCAFSGCNSLTELSISSDIEKIDNRAFHGCGAKTYIFTGKAPSIAGDAFRSVLAEVGYYSDKGDWKNISDKGYGGVLTWSDLYKSENGLLNPSYIGYSQEEIEGTFLKDGELPATPSGRSSEYAAELYRWAVECGYSEVLTQENCQKVISEYTPTVVYAESGSAFTEDEYKTWQVMRDILMINSMKSALNRWETKYIDKPERVDLTAAQKKLSKIIGVYTKYVKDSKRSPLSTALYNIYSLKTVQSAKKHVWKTVKQRALEDVDSTLARCIEDKSTAYLEEFLLVGKVALKEDGLRAVAADAEWTAREAAGDLAKDLGTSVIKDITGELKKKLIGTIAELHPEIKELQSLVKELSDGVAAFKRFGSISSYIPGVSAAVYLLGKGQEIMDAIDKDKAAQYFMIQYFLLHRIPGIYESIVSEDGDIIDQVGWMEISGGTTFDSEPLFQQLMHCWYTKWTETMVTKEERIELTTLASTAARLQGMSPEEMKNQLVSYWADRVSAEQEASSTCQVQIRLSSECGFTVVDGQGGTVAVHNPGSDAGPEKIAGKMSVPVVKTEKLTQEETEQEETEDVLIIQNEKGDYITAGFTSGEYGVRVSSDTPAVTVEVMTAKNTEYASVYKSVPAGTIFRVVNGKISATLPDASEYPSDYDYKEERSIVTKDVADLTIGFREDDTEQSITRDIILPQSGDLGSTVTWTSDDQSVISNDGKVTRQLQDSIVRMKAVVQNGAYKEEKSFTLTVLGTTVTVTCYSEDGTEILGSLQKEIGESLLEEELLSFIPDERQLSGWYYDRQLEFRFFSGDAVQGTTALFPDYAEDTPIPTGTPEPSLTPVPSGTPEPSLTPVPSGTPEPSLTPEPTESPVPTSTPEPDRQGTCGEGVNWKVDEKGTLIITGFGAVDSFPDGNTPWKEIAEEISAVVVSEGVSGIGSTAFNDLRSLRSASVADSVQDIAEGAFEGCDSLEHLDIPFTGTSRDATGEKAVLGAIFGKVSGSGIVQYHEMNDNRYSGYYYAIPSSLKAVNVTDAERIPFGAFCSCDFLQKITVNPEIRSIASCAFRGCSSLSEMVIPSGLEQIAEGAFNGCNSLESITLPFIGLKPEMESGEAAVLGAIFGGSSEGVVQYHTLEGTSLSGNTYAIPAALNKIILTEGTTIPAGAFCNCDRITEIHIPEGISGIGLYSFYGCTALHDIYYGGSKEEWDSVAKDQTGNGVLESVTIHYAKQEPEINEDEQTASTVAEMIRQIPGVIALTDETAVKEARSAYDQLSSTQKKYIDEELVTKLEEAEKQIEELLASQKQEQEDQEKAESVKAQILELPQEPGIEDKEKVQAARDAYGRLTEAQQELIPENVLKRLEEAELRLKDLEAADKPAGGDSGNQDDENQDGASTSASDQGGNIEKPGSKKDSVNLETGNGDGKEANASQDIPSSGKKAAQEGVQNQKMKDTRAAKTAVGRIDKMPGKSELSLADSKEVENAIKAFDALTPAQKKLIPRETVRKLQEVRKLMTEMKEEEKREEAAGHRTVLAAEKKIAALKEGKEAVGSEYHRLSAAAQKVGKNYIKLRWNRIKGAAGYLVYAKKCGRKNKYEKVIELKGESKTNYILKKMKGKKLKKKTYYNAVIVAFKVTKGKTKRVIATSKSIHAATAGGRYGNPQKLKLNKTNVKIKRKKTFRLKVVQKAKGGSKIANHRRICFESSMPEIASVNKKGVIKGRRKGKCTIYVYAQNGLSAKVQVKVA